MMVFQALVALTASKHNTAPEQVHIALAGADAHGHPTGMNVAWYTAEAAGPSTVQYGLAAGALTANSTGAAPITDSESP